ncbi:MAG: iron chelate uptake ABC transporter family permease subunit [Actinobacteria bacterium]|nr:iron chelate uptake ABC transporter family permease subunit [Actinomycetota bacterium]OJU86295.1 MAG: ABC transporter permease [Solirubrobacterales bacterium 70-9]
MSIAARRWSALGLGLAALLATAILAVAVGTRWIAPAEVWDALFAGGHGANGEIVRNLRLPRLLLGLEVGVALGLAGALMQALTRNPLADPGLLGVNAGAATAVVLATALLGLSRLTEYVWFAFLGAAVVSLLVYALGSRGRSEATPARMALVGTAVTAALSSFVAAMILLQPQVFRQFRFWELGSLAGRGFTVVAQVAPFVFIGALLALALGGRLNALALGEDKGRALGAHPGRIRGAGAVAVTLLCGAATAAAGPIAFVGLTVPHLARAITGPDQRWVLTLSLVFAPALLLIADVVGRVVDRPGEVQVAVVTAFLGAPIFIAIVRRRRIARL